MPFVFWTARMRIRRRRSAKLRRISASPNFHSVIIVTSKAHTRRVRTIWRKLVGSEPRMIVHYAQDDTLRRRTLVAPYTGRAGCDARDPGPTQRLGRLPVAPEPELIMPVRPRKPNEIAQQVVPLLLLGIGLVTTNNSVTFLDDESMISERRGESAANDARPVLFRRRQHGQPPLYEIILHFWLRWTGGNFDYLRIPSVLFFLAGLFLLGRASRHFTGSSSAGIAVIWVGVLWPFGFHFGRLATWYSFSFFLVAGLTLSYFKFLEDQTSGRWAALFFFWRLFDLDKLFRMGHSRVPRDRSVSSLASQRTCGNSQSSPGNCCAVVCFFPSSFFSVSLLSFPEG